MTDFILDLGSQANAMAAFQALGFWRPATSTDPAAPILEGLLGDNATRFFMVIDGVVQQPTGQTTTDPTTGQQIPVMAPVPGYWARLRILGTNPFTTGAMAPPAGVTIYAHVDVGTPTAPNVIWTSDGTTVAPAYVSNIGTIA